MTPDEILARVLYRDPLLLVLDKPAGLPVHLGPGGGETLESAFVHLRYGLPKAPSLAHRLDRDTPGCLVLGRHHKALSKLGKLFQAGRIGKTYWAVLVGKLPEERGTIDLPLAKITPKVGWKMIVDQANGQPSRTDWQVMGSDGRLSWVAFTPHTGRTHQIRVHAQALGCPVLGDPMYGVEAAMGRKPTQPLHLHSREIVIPIYPTRDPVAVTAPVPPHMQAAMTACGWGGEG